MKALAALICILTVAVVFSGCDKETQAAEAADAPKNAAPREDKAEGVAVARPVEKETGPETVVVTVNGEPITNAEITQEVDKRLEIMKERMPEGQEINQSQRDQIRMGVTDMLVQKEVLNQQMKKKNVTVSEEDVTEQIEKIAEANNQTLEQVKEEITQYGMTMEDLRSQVRPQVQMQKLAEAYMDDPEMTAEAKTFYDENPSYFQVPEQVRASHVLIQVDPEATEEEKAAAKKEAEEVLAKAKAGEDFAALAKEYSDDPGSKDTGGEYTFGRGKMVKPFEDTAFALEPGQVSDLVETQFGYHIIKLSEKTEAGTTSFEQAKERIVPYLLQQQMQENAKIEYSEAEQALRERVQQQQMMQQQMMQQMQQQMQQQQAQQAAEGGDTQTAETPAEE